ncbi:unnamed protein product [Prorocentrum cordatum]|uniref:Uncharacterized protein n=1 Tax=Prorocentrum cordatum TaxID=2364126 RepID=A0ABN9THC0_9DINO|nr:unnamed protein product [Polarella glacialis]
MGTELMIYDLQWELREVYCCCNIHGSGAYVVRAFILHQGKSGYIALPPVTKADDLRLAQPFSAALFKHLPQPWPTLLRDVLRGTGVPGRDARESQEGRRPSDSAQR